MKYPLIYRKSINTLLRNFLRPLSAQLPNRFKFPVNGTFYVRGVPGARGFRVATNPTSYFSRKLFWDGVKGFEYPTVRIFCELIKDARVFFDVGANIGYYSLLACSIRKEITVHAFEPMPSAHAFLVKNAALNGFHNITPVKLALSGEAGWATFYSIVNPKFSSFPQLTGDGGLHAGHSGKRSKLTFEVQVDTMDEYLKKHPQLKVDLMKLDTEANEHHVLRGASNLLSVHRPMIQVEILKGHNEKEIETLMAPYNYLYFRAIQHGLMPVNGFSGNDTEFVDHFLIPAEKAGTIKHLIIQ